MSLYSIGIRYQLDDYRQITYTKKVAGAKPKGKVNLNWSAEFAYAIGLLTTDGNLSSDCRHINFTSKDQELIELFKKCLKLTNVIGKKARGGETEKKYFVIQFGDVLFYNFLLSIGLSSNKSKTMAALKIPDNFFFDFLRGHLDGDGTFYAYKDPRWKSSFMFYTVFISASPKHIEWLQGTLLRLLDIKGHITKAKNQSCYQLRYAKSESRKLIPYIYYKDELPCLTRKKLKIKGFLDTMS